MPIDKTGKFLPTHGHSSPVRTPTYKTWRAMLDRCKFKDSHMGKYYGARGITVCERWKTLDKIDNNGNYEPENCRWATLREQGANRSDNHKVVVNGEELILSEACRKYHLNFWTVKDRLGRNWPVDQAFGLVPRKR